MKNRKSGKQTRTVRGKQVLFLIGIWWYFLGMCFQKSSFFLVFAQDQEETQMEGEEKNDWIEKEKIEEETTIVRVQWKDFEESTTDGREENQKLELSFVLEERKEEPEDVVEETVAEELWEEERETETGKKSESVIQTIPCSCKKTKRVCDHSNCKKIQSLIQEDKIPESTAKVTEHMKTDGERNQRTENFLQADSEKGKEFYRIQTADETIFYLIVDRSGSSEMVYFLTDIKEKDLFHVITEQQEKGISESEAVLSQENGNGWKEKEEKEEERQTESEESELESKGESKEKSGIGIFLFFSVAVVLLGGTIYFLKIYQRKGENFEEEEEDEEEELEEKKFEEEKREEEDFLEE